jgi:hypothetical protein
MGAALEAGCESQSRNLDSDSVQVRQLFSVSTVQTVLARSSVVLQSADKTKFDNVVNRILGTVLSGNMTIEAFAGAFTQSLRKFYDARCGG